MLHGPLNWVLTAAFASICVLFSSREFTGLLLSARKNDLVAFERKPWRALAAKRNSHHESRRTQRRHCVGTGGDGNPDHDGNRRCHFICCARFREQACGVVRVPDRRTLHLEDGSAGCCRAIKLALVALPSRCRRSIHAGWLCRTRGAVVVYGSPHDSRQVEPLARRATRTM